MIPAWALWAIGATFGYASIIEQINRQLDDIRRQIGERRPR